MFTPIRNLITYIQKNASGSTFFGGTSSSTELSETVVSTMESEMIETNVSIVPTVDTATLQDQNMNENNYDRNENGYSKKTSSLFVSTNPDSDPLRAKSVYKNGDFLNENDDEEEEKDIFLDFPPDSENDVGFPVSEVIVLNDPELNVSMNSDPAADPLALDDYNVHLGINSPNPLDSSTEGDVLFVVDIEEVVGQAPRLLDDSEETTRQLTAVKSREEQELRSDGSDSGLGSETSTLQTTVASVTDTSAGSIICPSPITEKIPLRSNLKRHIEDVVDGGGDQQLQKKPRRSINFDGVKVFYFPRIQGHGCVPSQGGCTLGMGANHISFKTFSLAEHAAELRRAHKLQLQEINPRGSSSEESDSDEELSEGSGSDLDAETNGFLQPVSPKQRRALLKAAGIRKIDPSEKIECRDIRNSREVCGCVCRDFCDPDTCACSQAGIKCQVDRAMFPCGCSRDACGNVIGRIEFNPSRVRTHFIHTIMRLDMENRQQKRSDELSSQIATSSPHMVYNNVPALASSSTTTINTYNPMPSYNSLDQSSNESYHHHMHQQYNVYNNHMPQTHPAGGLCVQMPPSMIGGAAPAAVLPTTHNPYDNTTTTTTTEPDSIALNGDNLHYQDGSVVYPPDIPPVVSYGDILTPYANTAPYDNTNSTYSTSNPYNSYHSPHHQHNNNVQPQQPYLGYNSTCNGEISDFSETHNSFINLNTPDASSARLSAINDLLHSTRNSTAALVAVSPLETNLDLCEARPQDHITDLGVMEITASGKKPTADCEKSLENSDTIRRPETPPDEEPPLPPPLAVIETNSVIKELLPKADEVLEKVTENRPEGSENNEKTSDNQVDDLKEKEQAQSQSPENICPIVDKSETEKTINGSNDIQADDIPIENSINNNTIPPIVETALA